MNSFTQILMRLEAGDRQAAGELLPVVYEELRKLAASRLSREQPGQTLQATALVHEAWLRLAEGNDQKSWSSRGHFFAAAAEAMRRILIDQARHKRSLKAGGELRRQDMPEVAAAEVSQGLDLLALECALEKLEQQQPRKAQLVKLRYFAGLTIDEAAKALDIAPSTANADWVYAKSWLKFEMQSAEEGRH